jgi:hypothetical protein
MWYQVRGFTSWLLRGYASDEHFISGFAYENDASDEKTTPLSRQNLSHGELLIGWAVCPG